MVLSLKKQTIRDYLKFGNGENTKITMIWLIFVDKILSELRSSVGLKWWTGFLLSISHNRIYNTWVTKYKVREGSQLAILFSSVFSKLVFYLCNFVISNITSLAPVRIRQMWQFRIKVSINQVPINFGLQT